MPPSFYNWVITDDINGRSDSATIYDHYHRDDQHQQLKMLQHQQQDRQDVPHSDWDFQLSSVITTDQSSSDILGAVEFDPSDRLLATGGISRKIRIYTINTLMDVSSTSCDLYLCTPAKLSSLRWKPNCNSHVVAAGDYDGVVTEYDVEKRMSVFERDEHGGRKVWSVAYSNSSSQQLAASGSDDGTAHLWDPRTHSSNGKIFPGENLSPVCSVEFDPAGGPLIGIGSADKKAYVYDLRMVVAPVSVFKGHKKTVTYVRFVGGGRVVTASTDGTIKMWDSVDTSEIRKYEGHVNNKSFVGLSIWGNGGLIGCGSESNDVYVYDLRWGDPIWVQKFGGDVGESCASDCKKRFVSGVCWRQQGQDECMLVAGGSDGNLQVSVGRKKKLLF